jgi:hypothetical protein
MALNTESDRKVTPLLGENFPAEVEESSKDAMIRRARKAEGVSK